MSMHNAPYIFSAFSKTPTCTVSGQGCQRVNFLAEADQAGVYAKAYVIPQSYSNCAAPTVTLHRGTYFDDLYQPYVTINPCCTEVDE